MDSPIRVVIEQPSLAKYRVPVFRELANRPGIDLTVLYGEAPGIPNVAPDGFRAEYVPMSQWSILGQVIRWHKAQWQAPARKDVDVVILSWNIRYLSLIPALLRARWRGVPVVLWGHGNSKSENRLRQFFRNGVTRLATAILLYDRTTAQKLVEAGLPKESAFVAPNAIDQTQIRQARNQWLADPKKLEQFRTENDLSGRRILLFVARLVPQRQVEQLLKATAKLREHYPQILAIVIGSGNDERRRLEELALKERLADYVRFLDGIYEEMLLAPWFLVAECFVFPAHMGLSLFHAYGYGLPVITSDALEQHGPEVIALEHEVNGLLYEAGSIEGLVTAISRVLDDHEFRKSLGSEALRTVEEVYTVDRMVDGFVEAARYCHLQTHQAA